LASGDALVSALDLPIKVIVTSWLLAIAYQDMRTQIVPNALTLPAMALLGGWRIVHWALYTLRNVIIRLSMSSWNWIQRSTSDAQAPAALRFMFVAWVLCFALWELHVIRGGDAKLLMGLFALCPSLDFALFLIAVVFILSMALLLLRLHTRAPQEIMSAVVKWVKEGPPLFTQRRLEEKGERYAWVYCLSGVVYLWLLW
jgi:Flp pilus assembly protein protease CpaA